LVDNDEPAMPTKKVGGVVIGVYNKLGLTNPQEILGGGISDTDKLGGSDFSNMPNGQNLKSLIDNYNTISSLTSGRNLNELVEEISRYQKLNNELHGIKNKLDSQKDYDEIKTRNEKLESQKTEIISELGLPKNSNSQQILDKIKELMGRPSISECKTIKTERDELKTEVETKKRKIAELENNKGNNVITKEALTEATSSILKD
jgi:hypothetical protein